MANIKIIKGSELPIVEDINKATFLAYEDKTISLKSGRIDLKSLTPFFQVVQEKGQSVTKAPSQKAWTDETIAKDKTILNVSQKNNKYDYLNKQEARNSVPSDLREKSQIIVYMLSNGKSVSEQFIGNNISNWGIDANWITVGVDEKVVSNKTDKSMIVNISQETGEIFNSQVAARNAVPTEIRKKGTIIAYSIGSGQKVSDFTKQQGASVEASTGNVLTGANHAQNQVVTTSIPASSLRVDFPIILTGGDNGGAFYNISGSFISGFKFATGGNYKNGERVPIDIPSGAVQIKTTYKADANLGTEFPPFDYFQFYIDGDVEYQEIIEQFNSDNIANWGSPSFWDKLLRESDISELLVGARALDQIEDKTSEVIGRLTLNRMINATNGAITEDLSRDISIIYMQPLKIGESIMLRLPYPSQMSTQPAIHIYNEAHARIDTVEYNDSGVYEVKSNYGIPIKLSFYTQVTGSGTIPDFNIKDNLTAYTKIRGVNTISRKRGDILLNNIDKLLYYKSDISLVNVTETLKAKIKLNLAIEVADGKIVTNTSGHKVAQMVRLKPNTQYEISGFQNTWEDKVPYLYLYDKSATDTLPSITASQRFEYKDLVNGKISFKTDDINYIMSLYIAYNGTTFPIFDSENSIKVLELTESNFKIVDESNRVISIAGSGGGLNDLSNETIIQIPTPDGVARVNVEVDTLPTFKGDTKECKVTLVTKSGIYFTKPGTIDIQGSTSASNPAYLQKNYSITLFNEDGSECDFKIGDTVFDTDAHLKCDWMESSHHRNIGVCSLVYRYNMMKEYPNRFPFEPYYSGYETGARCVVTGFPFEMYINGVWWGLYTWNLRFNRKNFNMKKGNANEILMKCGNSSNPWQESTIQVNDEYWDIKNPSKITDDTKATIMRLFNFLRTQNAATYKAELHNYMDIDSVLEYFIYVDAFQMIDNFIGNLGLCTYDGTIWYALVYDADTTLGLGFWGQSTTNPATPLQNEQKYAPSIWFPKLWTAFQDELKVKYADMRKKVLNLESVTNEFSNFEKLIGSTIFENDLKKWPTKPANTIPTNANHILTHYKQRLVYLDAKYSYGTI